MLKKKCFYKHLCIEPTYQYGCKKRLIRKNCKLRCFHLQFLVAILGFAQFFKMWWIDGYCCLPIDVYWLASILQLRPCSYVVSINSKTVIVWYESFAWLLNNQLCCLHSPELNAWTMLLQSGRQRKKAVMMPRVVLTPLKVNGEHVPSGEHRPQLRHFV